MPSRRAFLGWSAATLATAGLGGCGKQQAPLQRFPDFALPDLTGRTHALRDYAGKPLLINLWATWCPPCRGEMAALQTMQLSLGQAGLTVLAISVDEDVNLVREFVLHERLGLTVLLDGAGRWALQSLPGLALPTSYLVAGDTHLIRETLVGPREWASTGVQSNISARLGLR